MSDTAAGPTPAETFLTLDGVSPDLALRLGVFTGQLLVRAEARGRAAALAEAHDTIMREARRGPGAAPPRTRRTYTGGLRRAAAVIDSMLEPASSAAGSPTPSAGVAETMLPLFALEDV